ncbi:TPA: hypothetical protein ACGTRQ_005104 [Vibrio parahaemolyticus]
MNNQKQVYSVSYDLNSPGQSYKRLYERLTDLGGFRLMDSYWLVASKLNADGIKADLMNAIDSNDALFIAKCNLLDMNAHNVDIQALISWGILATLRD